MYERVLTTKDVLRIVELYKSGWGCKTISDQTGVAEGNVRSVLRGRCYAEITGGRVMNGKRPNQKLEYYK